MKKLRGYYSSPEYVTVLAAMLENPFLSSEEIEEYLSEIDRVSSNAMEMSISLLDAYINIALDLASNDGDKRGYKYLKLIDEMILQLHLETVAKYQADICTIQGAYLYWEGKYKEAKDMFQNAEELYIKSGEEVEEDLAVIYCNIGDTNYALGDKGKALICYEKSAVLFSDLNEKGFDNAIRMYNRIGDVLFHNGDYEKSLQFYFQAKDIAPNRYSSELNIVLIELYTSISYAMSAMGKLSEAKKFIVRAISISERMFGNQARTTITAYGAMVEICHKENDMNGLIEYCNRINRYYENGPETYFTTEHMQSLWEDAIQYLRDKHLDKLVCSMLITAEKMKGIN